MKITQVVVVDKLKFNSWRPLDYMVLEPWEMEAVEGGEVLFVIDIFKNAKEERQFISLISLDDIYQHDITYGQVFNDLGKSCFMQIIKNNIMYQGRSGKIVGKIVDEVA